MKIHLTLVVLALSPLTLVAQAPNSLQEKPVEKQSLPSIPKNLEQAHQELKSWFSSEELAQIKEMPSKDDIIAGFFEIRMDIHSMWRLSSESSSLANFFRGQGLADPGDMSALILDTFWRKQVGQEMHLDAVVADYKAFRLEHTWPSEAVVDPIDQSPVLWNTTLSAEGRPHRRIYLGRSERTGREVAYEHPRGAYMPGEEIAQILKEVEAEMAKTLPEGFNETFGVVPVDQDPPKE